MRIWAVVKRICQGMQRDKRTLALWFAAPLFILFLLYMLFNGDAEKLNIGAVNISPDLVSLLKKEHIQVARYKQGINVHQIIIDDDLDGLLQMKSGKLELTLQNSDPSSAKTLEMKVNQLAGLHLQVKNSPRMGMAADGIKQTVKVNYLYGNHNTVFFDVINPVLIGFFVFFFVFLISGIGLLKERTTGTLERVMSTPIRRSEIIIAYLAGFGIFAVIQTVIVVLFSVLVLDMMLAGSIWHVILINLLLAFVALSLGLLLSTFASSEFQMVQFIPIVVVPQLFFSGVFPLDGLAGWIQVLEKLMPLSYAADALKGVMYKGFSLSEVKGNLFALSLFGMLFTGLNIVALKKHRNL